MDPDKSPHPPAGRPAPSRSSMPSSPDRVTLPPTAVAGPSQSSDRSQTTLPPIHHLHPGLPHASMQPPPSRHPPRAASPRYMQGATYPLASASTLGVRRAPDDSDVETNQGPQKQKRRRQALSCTECKRRKIKCDRANPCGPCVRRGDQGKCQWHVIEPMEKYVTRSEFDELKARMQELEAVVMRAMPGMSSPAPTSRRASMSATMPMTSGHPAEPVHGTAIMPYQAYGATSVSQYPPRPGSPRSPTRGEPPPFYRHPHPPQPPGAGRSPTISYRSHPTASASSRSAPAPGSIGGIPLHLPPPASPRSPARALSPGMRTSPSVRRSSISLAEITTPYHAPAGSKNHCAQTTPPPGPRLRPSPPSGPAPALAPVSPHLRIHIVDLRRRVPV
ncbi:hypothetical protein BC628DRAFT_644054 [Trametes gibbosa]|nr:hypothetical protein BC628DRAFT_644054 [Trametes gibbosa]UVI59161.1 Zn(2)-Cys(6)63 [Trametes gibbosa]